MEESKVGCKMEKWGAATGPAEGGPAKYVLDNRRAAVAASRLSDITGCSLFNFNL